MRKIVGFIVVSCVGLASAVPVPQVITEKRVIYDANQNANPSTGAKAGWSTSASPRSPLYPRWQVAEHGFFQVGNDQWLLAVMETNRSYLAAPGGAFVDAVNFVSWPSGFPDTIGTFNEGGYWRGNNLSVHDYVWAPFLIKEGGTYYMFYTALYNGLLACYLATSSTATASPSAWVQFDPVPATPTVEPMFFANPSTTTTGFRDFHVVKSGSQFQCYYMANPIDPSHGNVAISEMRMRTSTNITNWPDANEQVLPAFKRVNAGTRPDRHFVDYEKPKVEKGDDGTFYLFIGRHGTYPADTGTNPSWVPIPNSTEVYYSTDGGFTFPVANQLPNLMTPAGKDIASGEIVHSGARWFTTSTENSNDLSTWPFDSCPDGGGIFTCHSPELSRVVQGFESNRETISIAEFVMQASAAGNWMIYK